MKKSFKKIPLMGLLFLFVFFPKVYAQDEPALPIGLGEIIEEPALPSGLDSGRADEPFLPEGLAAEGSAQQEERIIFEGDELSLPFDLSGFWEARGGVLTQNSPYEREVSLAETRLQLELEKRSDRSGIKVVADFLYDPVLDDYGIRLDENQGWLLLREAVVSLTPVDFMDFKAGRQILTWGTGDMLFINDLFPKDWESFFIGRDPEYLKAPSDALKASLFSKYANLDVVYTPRFDPDRFIDGRRVSYWNGNLGRLAGRGDVIDSRKPKKWFRDDEIALRLYKNVRGYELAAYAYRGFWKSPGGQDVTGTAIFPNLAVYGASFRGNVGEGIGNIEVGYYDSKDDRSGNKPLINNSEIRALVGYEQEVATDFTAAFQYYLEYMKDYGAYKRALPATSRKADRDRHVVTLRLTKLLMSQNLKLSLFTYYSPSDKDAYLRPKVHYKINDYWSAEIGGNVFLGKEDHTFFGQFEESSNFYAGCRYSF